MTLTAAGATLIASCTTASSTPPAPGPQVGQQLDAPLPTSVTSARLTASDGTRLTLSSLRGKVVVISDVMTLCQESCPLDTADVVAAARAVDKAGLGDKVVFLSITIDPTRDTPAQLAAYRRLYTPVPNNWVVASGSPHTISTVWKEFGVYIHRVRNTRPLPRNWRTGQPLTYDLTHSDELFFVDERSRERFLLEGTPHVAAGAPIPRTIAKFMDARGRHNIGHPDPLAWTLRQELQVISWLVKTRIAPRSR